MALPDVAADFFATLAVALLVAFWLLCRQFWPLWTLLTSMLPLCGPAPSLQRPWLSFSPL
jgi:hypothetical protein